MSIGTCPGECACLLSRLMNGMRKRFGWMTGNAFSSRWWARSGRIWAIYLCLPNALLASDTQEEWTNVEGKTMRAELVGYEAISKSVAFRKLDGSTFRYPLIKLSGWSKLKAYASPGFRQDVPKRNYSYSKLSLTGWLMMALLYCLVNALAVFTIWIAARILVPGVDFRQSLGLQLKLISVDLVAWMLQVMVFGWDRVAGGNGFSGYAGWEIGVFLIISIIRMIVIVLLVSRHFEIGIIRTFFFGVTVLFVSVFVSFSLVVFVGIGGAVLSMLLPVEGFVDTVFSELVLRPLQLI